jgi:hypothetical protein
MTDKRLLALGSKLEYTMKDDFMSNFMASVFFSQSVRR